LAGGEVIRRRRGIWVGAVLALVLVVASGAEAKTFGGVVADVPTGTHRPPSARIANLPYSGGPVLHSNRTHVIFWQPSGSGLGYDPGYVSQIETFLARVAADSHWPTNVYGLSGQYRDSRPAAYDSTYGGSVLSTDPLPANGCTEPQLTGPGWSLCLDDLQLEAEVARVIRVDHLPTTPRDIYFLVTPNGLGSCETTGTDNCSLGGSANGYCGYHSSSPEGTILYAVIPYNAVSGHCQSGNPRPNSSTADPAISTISHEHNEMVTDPVGTAWIDSSNMEDGDLCLSNFGPDLGAIGSPQAWNEVIHGGRYYLQEEWSNDNGSCQPRDESYPIWFSGPARTVARKSQSFAAHAGDPDGSIAAYAWFFGDGRPGRGRVASHAFKRAGYYRVVLRTTDRDGNWGFYARIIQVAKAPAKRVKRRR
jgi:PKD domain